jgi:hypothetical protein
VGSSMKKGIFVLYNRTCNPFVGQVTSGQTQAARRWWCKLTKCKSGRSSRVVSLACLPTCINALPLNSLPHSDHEWSTETRPKSDMPNAVPRTAHQDTERREKNARRLGCLMFCPAEGRTEADQALERGLEWGIVWGRWTWRGLASLEPQYEPISSLLPYETGL